MRKAGTKTTTSGLDWNVMLGLTQRLKQDGNHKFYLLITCGSFLGLRAGDLLRIRWDQVNDRDDFTITEQKTGKQRKLTINPAVKDALAYVKSIQQAAGKHKADGFIFANRQGQPISISYVNKQFHKIFPRYNVAVQNASTHTMRKTFGKRVWEMDNKSERSLIYLSEIFSHASVATTRKYIGVTESQIADIYIQL